MRLALTHNLKREQNEEQAEFNTPAAIQALVTALECLGHHVIPVEVTGPLGDTVAALRAANPDLVFNTAEGRRGRFREAFFPALFEELGIRYTASDPHTLALTLDKQTTKRLLIPEGVPVVPGILASSVAEGLAAKLRYPVIAKPNFEGSSKGITQDSVCETPEQLRNVLESLLERYPDGVLVEEFLQGIDVTVPYVAGASSFAAGVLQPTEYVVAKKSLARRRWNIYDYDLKGHESDAVSTRTPAQLPAKLLTRLRELSATVFRSLRVVDLGRIDYRISESGEPFFLEVNALPSLEPGAGIFVASQAEGLDVPGVLRCIIASACRRYRMPPP